MAARAYSGKKPKNLKHTLRVFLSYLGRHKKMLAVVAVLVTISAGANLLGTYMIRPVVNGLADGDVHTLLRGVMITALILRSRWRKEQLKNNQVFILLTAFQSSPGFYVPIGFPQNPGKPMCLLYGLG